MENQISTKKKCYLRKEIWNDIATSDCVEANKPYSYHHIQEKKQEWSLKNPEWFVETSFSSAILSLSKLASLINWILF